jgi:hypothetical protein
VRRIAGLVVLIAAPLTLTSCGKGAFERDLAVRFNPAPGSTRPDPAQVRAVRTACPGSKTVILKPAGSTKKLSQALTPIRYDARKADDRQIERVAACVRVLPGVASVGLDNEDY